jgi:hypothetical protein
MAFEPVDLGVGPETVDHWVGAQNGCFAVVAAVLVRDPARVPGLDPGPNLDLRVVAADYFGRRILEHGGATGHQTGNTNQQNRSEQDISPFYDRFCAAKTG